MNNVRGVYKQGKLVQLSQYFTIKYTIKMSTLTAILSGTCTAFVCDKYINRTMPLDCDVLFSFQGLDRQFWIGRSISYPYINLQRIGFFT